MEKKKVKIYTIFALVCGNEVLIGKTTSWRVSAVYGRHCRGEVSATRHWAKLGVKAKFHLLIQCQMQAYEAYRLIVAYVHFFQAAGYEILNSVNTIERAGDLHPETQILVSEIQKETTDQLLVRTLVLKPSAADIHHNAEENILLTPANQKLTIRLTRWEKERLDHFARKMNMTQRGMLQFLLSYYEMPKSDFPPWEDDIYVRAILGALRDENRKLHSENLKYREDITLKEDKTMNPIVDLCEQLRAGINTFFLLMESAHPIPLEVERRMYKHYPQASEYRYPDQAGVYILRPNAILTGKGRYRAKFIVGTCEDGTKYKFRYYPKEYFAGITPTSENFMLRGSVWLMGCRQAKDSAMDLVFAFPLNVRYASRATQTSDSIAQELLSDILGRDTTDVY